tara:strand:+ start:258 stop:1136 length:879 start_codon:yes stop_codon:yes gene_type:complete
MRIAALGCSHTCGYHVKDMPEDKVLDINTWPFSGKWNDNNWAEFYINDKNADGVIFANSSNGWWEYSEWLSFLFKKYDDIKEVVVQNTYWNRFRLSMMDPPDYERMVPLDELYHLEHKKGNIDLWLKRLHNEEKNVFDIPFQCYPEDYSNRLHFNVKFDPRFMMDEPDLRAEPYMKVKTWMEIMSLKAQREWFKEMYILQELCRNNGAELKLFSLNKWTWIPDEMLIPQLRNSFYNFDHIQVAPTHVEEWFLREKKMDITKTTIDGEHFGEDIHKIIALEYLPKQFERKQNV